MPNQPQSIIKQSTRADRGIIQRPQLTPHLQHHIINERQLLLVSESFNTLLHGELQCYLIPLLDGTHELREIVTNSQDKFSEQDIYNVIFSLSSRGYIVSAEHGLDRKTATYWSSLGSSPRWAEHQLVTHKVEIVGDSQLAQSLTRNRVQIGTNDPVLSLVHCTNYLEERLNQINNQQLLSKKPWALVQLSGLEPMIGPIFKADRIAPCWQCLTTRMKCHKEVHEFLRSVAGEEGAFKPIGAPPAIQEFVAGFFAAEIAKWIVLREHAAINKNVLAVNLVSLESCKHQVTRRPQCHACGDESLFCSDREPKKLRLVSCAKSGTNKSGSRTVPPEMTLAKYRHLISRISGVVTWLSRTTDDHDSWLHVAWAGSNLGLKTNRLSSLRHGLRSKSAGKGSSRAQAQVSALCEAIERYSGGLLGDEIQIKKCLVDFADDSAIHPNSVQLFSEDQLQNAEKINDDGHPYNVIPQPFCAEREYDWTPVWSFTQSRQRYLPTSMLYMMVPEQRGPADYRADSNGCAAGNSIEEAILQGFLELVERDAFAIWWYNKLQVAEVDLSVFDDEFLMTTSTYYEQYNRELWLLDITSDFGIPSYVAVSRRIDVNNEDIIYGAGSHLDAKIAATRAVCELNQCLTWLPRPGRQDSLPTIDDPFAISWWKNGRLDNCPWLKPLTGAKNEGFSKHVIFDSDDLRADVDYCRSLVEAQGMEFLVLDQTRPDIKLPVVRVIVPGMRHFRARYAAGRLYDVPVKMGLQKYPLREFQLNSVPVVI